MKKRYFFLSPLALLLALPFAINGLASAKEETVFVDSTEDEIGEGFLLPPVQKKVAKNNLHPSLGVQLIPGTKEGCRSLRFVAAIDGYKSIAKGTFTRVVKNGETIVKEKASFDAEKVYTSVKDFSSIQWSEAPSSSYGYFMVYTLKNIPADHIQDVVDVEFTLSYADYLEEKVSEKANLAGLSENPELGKGIELFPLSEEKATWYAMAESESIEEAVVPSHKYEKEGFVLLDKGEVVSLGHPDSNAGAFYDCASLSSIILPSNLRYINPYCFSGCTSLTEITLPEKLETIGQVAFRYCTISTVNLKSVALSSFQTGFPNSVEVVNVAKSVTSLPETFIGSGAKAGRVNYEGTRAQWNAIARGIDNGLDIRNVYCSDTEEIKVTYSFEGATVKVNGRTYTGSYECDDLTGNTPLRIGDPSKKDAYFLGWYDAATGGNEIDFTRALTGNLTMYAHFADAPEGVRENPVVISEYPYDGSVTVRPGMDDGYGYFKFTADVTDVYYFDISGYKVDEENSGSAFVGNYRSIKVFSEDGTEIPSSGDWSVISTGKVTDRSNYDNKVAIRLDEGETVIIGAAISSYSVIYGEIQVDFYTREHDSYDTAIPYVFNAETNIQTTRDDSPTVFGFTATATTSYALYLNNPGGELFNLRLYEEGTEKALLDYAKANYKDTTFDVKEGTRYFIAFTADRGSGIRFRIGNPPTGSSLDNPTPVEINGETIDITPKGQYTYYSFTLDKEEDVRFVLSGGNSSSRYDYDKKSFTLYNEDGSTNIEETLEKGTYKRDTSSYSSSYYYFYGTTMETSKTLPAGTYVARVGYYGKTSGTYRNFSFRMAFIEPGFSYDKPAKYDLEAETQECTPESSGFYYKIVPSASATYRFTATADSGTTSLSFRDSSHYSINNVVNEGNGVYHLSLDAGETYYMIVTNSAQAKVSIANSLFESAYSSLSICGTYYGGHSSGAWNYSFGADGLWCESNLLNSFTLTETENGYSFYGKWGSWPVLGIMENGSLLAVRKGSDSSTSASVVYLASKDGVSGGEKAISAHTSSNNLTTGTEILSITKKDGTRLYGAIIDGVYYLDLQVEFTEGSAINASGSAFAVATRDGVSLGSYTSSGSTIVKA